MNRNFAVGLLLAVLAVSPARSQVSAPAPTFTPAQRAEIVTILRDALKSDPSILRDAVSALQADEGMRHEAAMRAAIGAAHTQLTGLATDQVLGNPAGDVTLIEFYDVRCPYCRRMLPVFDTLAGPGSRGAAGAEGSADTRAGQRARRQGDHGCPAARAATPGCKTRS